MIVVVINVYVCVRSREQLIITLTPLPRYFDASDPRGESRLADANNHLCGFYSLHGSFNFVSSVFTVQTRFCAKNLAWQSFTLRVYGGWILFSQPESNSTLETF